MWLPVGFIAILLLIYIPSHYLCACFFINNVQKEILPFEVENEESFISDK